MSFIFIEITLINCQYKNVMSIEYISINELYTLNKAFLNEKYVEKCSRI
jgi:hypothetical protein